MAVDILALNFHIGAMAKNAFDHRGNFRRRAPFDLRINAGGTFLDMPHIIGQLFLVDNRENYIADTPGRLSDRGTGDLNQQPFFSVDALNVLCDVADDLSFRACAYLVNR
jgi:hypothetical protein